MTRKRIAAYLRVSTSEQTTDNQLLTLQAEAEHRQWDIVDTFVDHGISGSKGRDKRPALDKMLRQIGRYDMVAVVALDRLSRSTTDLLDTLSTLEGAKVALYIHNMQIDTSTPAGRMFFTVTGAFAEFERNLIRERVHAGMARAKATGTRSGRAIGRPLTDPAIESRVQGYLTDGKGILATAKLCGIGSSTVQRIRREMTTIQGVQP